MAPPFQGEQLAADRKSVGMQLGTRVIVSGINTAKLKQSRQGLRPALSFIRAETVNENIQVKHVLYTLLETIVISMHCSTTQN